MKSGPVRKTFEERVDRGSSRYSKLSERLRFEQGSDDDYQLESFTPDGKDALLLAHSVIMSAVSRTYFRVRGHGLT